MSAESSNIPSENSLAIPNDYSDIVDINIDHIKKIQIDEFLNWLRRPKSKNSEDSDLNETTVKSIESDVTKGTDKSNQLNESETLEVKRSDSDKRSLRNGKYKKSGQSGRSSFSRVFSKSGGSGKSVRSDDSVDLDKYRHVLDEYWKPSHYVSGTGW